MRTAAFLVAPAIPASFFATTARAQIYCTGPGVPAGCIVRPAEAVRPGVGAPGVGVDDRDPNRGGPVNRPGRR